jgi:hypothetical protein
VSTVPTRWNPKQKIETLQFLIELINIKLNEIKKIKNPKQKDLDKYNELRAEKAGYEIQIDNLIIKG